MIKHIFIIKLLFFAAFLLPVNMSVAQTDIEFSKTNFPDNTKLLRSIKKNIKRGDIHFNNDRYIDALTHYKKSQNFNPDNSELNYKIGLCYFHTNKDTNAISNFEKTLILNKNMNKNIYYYLGKANQYNYNFKDAIKYYEILADSISIKNNFEDIKEIEKYINECQSGLELKKITDSTLLIINLGSKINSDYQEYSPYVTVNDSLLFFTSTRSTNFGNINTEDIYYSEKKDSIWNQALNIGKPINTSEDEAVSGISEDGKILYVYAGINKGDIFYSRYTNKLWSLPESVSLKINSEFTESSLCFSKNKDTVFFVSNRKGTLGGKDIFYSVKHHNLWSKPQNLGNTVNSKYNEESVFWDGDTLYFASMGHNTTGAYDIFKTYILSNGKWSKPENLGFPVNSPYDDLFYVESKTNRYFSSDRPGGFGQSDIYQIENIKSEIEVEIFTSIEDTSVSTFLIKPQNITISNVLFEINKYENYSAYPNLDKLAEYLLNNPNSKISIKGYTDTQGNSKYNLNLSLKRAEFIKQHLIFKGVPDSSLILISMGEKDQLSKNKDKKGRYIWPSLKYNRRVEFEVLVQGKEEQLIIKQIDVPQKYQITSKTEISYRYSIFLKSSIEKLDLNIFKLPDVYELINSNGDYNYFYGKYKDLEELELELMKIREQYPNAVIFTNNR